MICIRLTFLIGDNVLHSSVPGGEIDRGVCSLLILSSGLGISISISDERSGSAQTEEQRESKPEFDSDSRPPKSPNDSSSGEEVLKRK